MASDARATVEAAIPHRDPFLFVDEVLACEGPGRTPTSLRAAWRVPADGDWFRGHYPGRPILPGVLACEFAFQSAAVLLSMRGAASEGDVPVLTGIENARFKSTVEPGERLVAEVELLEELSGKHYMRALVRTDERDGGRTVARLRFAIAEVDEAQRERARAVPTAAGSGTAEGPET